MENLTSLRSLDASGGPSGTGRPTPPLPGTPRRDFESELAGARREEQRSERRQRTETQVERRADERRDQRVAERRQSESARSATSADRAELGASDATLPAADSPAVEPPATPAGETPQGSEAHETAADAPRGPSQAATAGPARGAGAALDALPVLDPAALALGPAPLAAAATPPQVGTAPAPARPAATPGGNAPAGDPLRAPDAAAAAPAGAAGPESGPTPEAAEAPQSQDAAPRATAEPAPTSPDGRQAPGPRTVEAARAASPSAPPPPAAAPETAEHAASILQQVRLRFLSGSREATLQLEPAHLGRLAIRLEVRRGVTRAEVVAEQAATLEALARHEPELRAALADAGFEGVEVELRHAGDGERDNPFAPRREGGAPAQSAPPPPELVRALATRLAPTGGVDTYA